MVRTWSPILNSRDFVIPSEARDLQFAAKMQIPRSARDDNFSKGVAGALLRI